MRLLILFLLGLTYTGAASAQTPVEIQPVKQLVRTSVLGTCSYTPTAEEKPFLEKLDRNELVTGSVFAKPYSIRGKKGTYVSWFGIVRGISTSRNDPRRFSLLLQQKFFDGLTDCHIMLVAQTGGGDFRATLEGSPDIVPALALVRVYGKVVTEESQVPSISVEYMRVWPWLGFTFSDLGAEDHSNPEWAKYCKFCKRGGRIYNPFPTEDYYLDMLGDPKDFGLNFKGTN